MCIRDRMYGMSPIGVVDRETAPPEIIARAANDIIKRAEMSASRIIKKYHSALVSLSRRLFEAVSYTHLSDHRIEKAP